MPRIKGWAFCMTVG